MILIFELHLKNYLIIFLMSNEIILIGGGGNCKKIIDIIYSKNIKIKGILDDKFENKIIDFYRNTKIIGKINSIEKYKDFDIIITIGSVNFRKNFIKENYEYNFINLFHNLCYISESAKLGKGIIIHYGVYVGSDAYIDDFCHLDTNSSIEHDCNLEKNVIICPNTTICGGVKIKENVFIGAGTTIINSSLSKEININKNCFIGAGSLITKSINKNTLYYGTPLNNREKII